MRPKVTYFTTPAALCRWFKTNHTTAAEIWVGFFKKGSGKASITWPESVDEALCVGWIDGVRKRIDALAYTIRFTPRRPGSVWSHINIRRAEFLIKAGRMTPAGRKAYEARRENRSGIYAYEQRKAELEEPYGGQMKKHKAAWEFFQSQPPSYRKVAAWWVVSAKKEETRRKRLEKLIALSAAGKRA